MSIFHVHALNYLCGTHGVISPLKLCPVDSPHYEIHSELWLRHNVGPEDECFPVIILYPEASGLPGTSGRCPKHFSRSFQTMFSRFDLGKGDFHIGKVRFLWVRPSALIPPLPVSQANDSWAPKSLLLGVLQPWKMSRFFLKQSQWKYLPRVELLQ